MLSSAMDVLVGVLSAALAVLLIVAGIHKAFDRKRMIEVLREFAGLPARWAPLALVCVVSLELATGVALAWPSARFSGGMAAMFLWAGYAALLLRSVLAGERDVDCGCGFQTGREPIGYLYVTRAVALAGAAAVIVLAGPGSAHGTLYWLLDLVGGVAFYAVYFAVNSLLELRAPLRSQQ